MPLLERLEGGEWEPRTTLLSPFDNLIIDRLRLERMFGFSYRMEIYVPPGKRRFGYYVLPVLHGDRFIGRLDPVLDRSRRRLEVKALHLEPGVRPSPDVGAAVGNAIEDLGAFTGAAEISYEDIPARWRRVLQ